MFPIEPEKQKLAAALEQLEAEQRRRDDERVAAGAAVRSPLYLVTHDGEHIADAVEEAKTRKFAELRAVGDHRAIIFDEPFMISTGVPRPKSKLPWAHEPAPSYPDRYAKERQGRPEPQDDGLIEPPPPVKWTRFTTVTRNPKGDDPGQIIEAEWSIQHGGTLCVRDLDHKAIGTFELHDGDSILVAARRVVREKGRSGAFWDPITLPDKPRP